MSGAEVIRYEDGEYKSSIDNIKEVERVTKQTQRELKKLQGDVGKNSFFEKKENNSVSNERENKFVVYDMDLVKRYLKFCVEDKNFKITPTTVLSPLVMAVQIALESLGQKYDVGNIDGLLKLNNSSIKSNTEKAIIKFQKDNGLKKIDGIPGKKTIGKILDLLENKPNEEVVEKGGGQSGHEGNEGIDIEDQQVKEVQELIDNLPFLITIYDENKIEIAIEAYNKLTFQQKGKINRTKLDIAENNLRRAKEEAENRQNEAKRIEDAISLIEALPDDPSNITLENESDIIAAKNAAEQVIDKLDQRYKSKLKDAEDRLNVLKAEQQNETQLKAQIKDAEDKIKNLPTNIIIENKDQVEEARRAAEIVIDKINPQLKSKLETAEAALDQLTNQAKDAEALRNQQIQDVQDKINALSGYTVGQESVIKNARYAYNDLAGDLKNSVTTTNLDNAEQQRVKYVEELINKIPQNITLNDGKISGEEAIKKTRDAYNKLDYLKNKISNELVSKLETAENKLNELRNQANEAEALRAQQIKNVQDKINKLSGYAVGKESVIKDARDAYDALAGNLRGDIDLSKLEKAENERVQYVEELINKLPKPADITIDDESKINEARNAYQKLYGNLSIKVNLMTLINAENALDAAKKEEKARLEEEARRQRESEENNNPNIVTNPKVSVNITPDYADSNHFKLKNRDAYLNIDILQGPKLEAKTIDEVGGIGSSIMEGICNAEYGSAKTEGGIKNGYGKEFTNMWRGRGAGTRSLDRFRKPGQRGVLDEEKLIDYCNERNIKSFVFCFGGNEARSGWNTIINAYNDIKLMGEVLANNGIQPVLTTCPGEKIIEHSIGGHGKVYPLIDKGPEGSPSPFKEYGFNEAIRKLGEGKGRPVIDYAKIDVGNVWYDEPGANHPSGEGYRNMRQKIKDNLSK